VNGWSFEYCENLCAFAQFQIGDRLTRYKRDELKTHIQCHFRQNAAGHDLHDTSTQMISRAALVSAAFLERHVFASDANVKVQFITAGISRNKFCRPHLKERDAAITLLDATGRNCLDSDCRCNFAMLRSSKDFLRRTALQNAARAHNQHLIAERQRIDPIMRDDNGGDAEIP
jgi:hypothetical protein